ALGVPLGPADAMLTDFERAYRRRFSFLMRDKQVVVEAVSVELTAASDVLAGLAAAAPGDGAGPDGAGPDGAGPDGAGPDGAGPDGAGPDGAGPDGAGAPAAMFVSGAWTDVPCVRRSDLSAGQTVPGPALIVEDFATTVLEPGWQAQLTGRGDLLLARVQARQAQRSAGTAVDPVMLEIFNNLFMSVAEQMGVRLRSTAHSVNIKERLDFS